MLTKLLKSNLTLNVKLLISVGFVKAIQVDHGCQCKHSANKSVSTLNAEALERALKEVTNEKACLQQQTSDLTKKLTFYGKENSSLNSLLSEKRIELKENSTIKGK